MKKNLKNIAFFAMMTSCVFAQENDSSAVNQLKEVVITDTKFAQSKEKSGKVITTISQEEIQKKSGQNLVQILNQVAGVEINGSNSVAGKNLGYYIRGGKNNQVLILIDGIPVTDASGINMEFDLRLLSIDEIEKIEIMKGAASTLYGTGAATAVINISLKKAGKKEIQGKAYINIGSNNTVNDSKINGKDFNQGFSISGNKNKLTYYTGFNSSESNGISQIAAPENVDYEKDRFSRQNVLAKIGVKPTDKLILDFVGNYDRTNNNYDFAFDNSGFNDNDKNTTTSEQFRFGFLPKYKYKKGELNLNSSFNQLKRDYIEENSYTNVLENSLYKSRSVVLDLFNKYAISDELFFVLGENYQFHDMLSETPFSSIAKENTKFNMLDTYATLVYNSSFGLNVNLGGRWNHHSEYGNHFVYNLNPSYHFSNDLKIFTSISTAFVSPSLYQLYSEYGNATLTPEENTTVEAGFETNILNKKLQLNAVAFYREQDNSIGFYFDSVTFDAYYINILGINKAKGVETSVKFQPIEKVTLNANYTFTQVDKALDRLIPKHKINTSLDFQATKKLFLNASYQYIDSRNDAFYDATTFAVLQTKLDSYSLVNASVKFEVLKNRMSVFGAVTNLFNEEFVENIGYSTLGRNFRLGLNLNF